MKHLLRRGLAGTPGGTASTSQEVQQWAGIAAVGDAGAPRAPQISPQEVLQQICC